MKDVSGPNRFLNTPLHQSYGVDKFATLIRTDGVQILIHSNFCQIGCFCFFRRFVFERGDGIIDEDLMCQRNACIQQGDEQNTHDSIFDDPLFLVFCKQQNGSSEDEDHQQFEANVTQLGCSSFTESLQSGLVVPWTDVHGEEDGRYEHSRHPNHRWELTAKVSCNVAHTTSRHEAHLSASTVAETIGASLHL